MTAVRCGAWCWVNWLCWAAWRAATSANWAVAVGGGEHAGRKVGGGVEVEYLGHVSEAQAERSRLVSEGVERADAGSTGEEGVAEGIDGRADRG